MLGLLLQTSLSARDRRKVGPTLNPPFRITGTLASIPASSTKNSSLPSRLQRGAVPPAEYTPRDPGGSILQQIVREHFETFRAEAADLRGGEGLPRFVEEEFEAFLRCGWLAGGFARFRCGDCGCDRLVASPTGSVCEQSVRVQLPSDTVDGPRRKD